MTNKPNGCCHPRHVPLAREMNRLSIWCHRKVEGHHTRTYWRSSPVVVQCADCPREWRL